MIHLITGGGGNGAQNQLTHHEAGSERRERTSKTVIDRFFETLAMNLKCAINGNMLHQLQRSQQPLQADWLLTELLALTVKSSVESESDRGRRGEGTCLSSRTEAFVESLALPNTELASSHQKEFQSLQEPHNEEMVEDEQPDVSKEELLVRPGE